VDYVEDLVVSKKDQAAVALWFGGLALDSEPEQRLTKGSANVTRIDVVNTTGAVVGLDTGGTYSDGHRWRKFVAAGSGAVYENASPTDAVLFDTIIDSACHPEEPL
jgi:hypothetical protein